jgi:hypothetical protein
VPVENGFEEVNPGMDQDVEEDPEVKKDVLFYILSLITVEVVGSSQTD